MVVISPLSIASHGPFQQARLSESSRSGTAPPASVRDEAGNRSSSGA